MEITVTRCQDDNVGFLRVFEHINCDAYVPVSFWRAVASFNEWLQFDVESNRSKNILKFLLFFVSAKCRVGPRYYHLPALSRRSPEFVVIKIALIHWFCCVINILHINKYRYFFHNVLLRVSAFKPLKALFNHVVAVFWLSHLGLCQQGL